MQDRLGRHEQAIASAREAISILLDQFPAGHPHVLTTRGNLATLLGNAGLFDKAREQLGAVVGAMTESLGADAAETLIARNNLAMIGFDTLPVDQAAQAAAEFAAIADAADRQGFGFMIAPIRRNQGRALLRAGRLLEAERALRTSFDAAERSGPAAQARTAQFLADVYDAQGRPVDAQTWRDRATALLEGG
jgi:tetratricopeptide (TPR) repeat protein